MQFRVGLIGYIFGAVLYAAMMSFPYLVVDTAAGDTPQFTEMRTELEKGIETALAKDAVATQHKQSGDYVGLVADRIANDWHMPLTNAALFVFETLPLMLIGMALYRFGFFSGAYLRSAMIRWGWIGLVVGGLAHLGIGLLVQAGGFTYYMGNAAFVGWSPLPRLAMVLGLAALLVAYCPPASSWLGQRISAAGRAAFSNYLGTSILMLFVFHGWALGLFGQLNRPQLYLVVVITCVAMLVWSKPWFERYRYGPLEWLWRCLTYGKRFALKR